MIVKFFSLFFSSFCYCQWAFLGGSIEGNNLGKYSGTNLWPCSRFNPGFALDGNELFLFGGFPNDNFLCDMWSLNIETLEWKLLGPSSDPLNSCQGFSLDQGKFSSRNWPYNIRDPSILIRQELVYLFPTFSVNEEDYSNFFIYNRSSNEWFFDKFQIPTEFQHQALVLFHHYLNLDATTFYLIGYDENIYVANMTSLEFSVYPEAKYSFPAKLSSAVTDHKSIYIFGGEINTQSSYNYVVKFNFSSNEVIQLNRYKASAFKESNFGPTGVFNEKYFPRGRASSFVQLRLSRNQLIMFGGDIIFDFFSDLWIFDLNSTMWAYLAGPIESNSPSHYKKKGIASFSNFPSSRSHGVSCYDDKMEILYIFGGTISGNGALNDIWAFYFKQISKSTLKVNSTVEKTNFSTEMKVSLKEDNLLANNYCFPIWITAIIVLVSALMLMCCFGVLLKKIKNSKEESTEKTGAMNQTSIMKTLLNTNIGLSDHLSLQQDSNLFPKVKSLAKGGQAEVFLVNIMNEKLVKESGSNQAVQKIFFNSAKSEQILLHEVSIMAMLRKYRYFVSILAYTLDPLSIVMKYYPEGTLDEWIKRNGSRKKRKLRFSIEIASALRTMHSHELAHCDIKTQNVLIELRGREPHCCLSDFGITQVLSNSIVATKEFKVLNLRGLSCSYASPESFFGFQSKRSWDFRRSDVYSFGCLIYEITTNIAPWDDPT